MLVSVSTNHTMWEAQETQVISAPTVSPALRTERGPVDMNRMGVGDSASSDRLTFARIELSACANVAHSLP